MGRPSSIDDVIGQRIPDGETTAVDVTAFERIVASLRSGNYFEQACAQAGIHRETGYGWLRTGARQHARLARALLADDDLTPHERRCIAFSDAVAQAEAEWEVNANNVLENLARGGITSVTTTEKQDAEGRVLERSIRTERLAPNAQVIEWRLTRRFPERYGNRIEVEQTAGASLSSEDRARILADEIRAHQEAAAMGAEAALTVRGGAPAELAPRCGAHPHGGGPGYRHKACVREAGHDGRHRYDVGAPRAGADATVGHPSEPEATP